MYFIKYHPSACSVLDALCRMFREVC
jgi:hypothetical protein